MCNTSFGTTTPDDERKDFVLKLTFDGNRKEKDSNEQLEFRRVRLIQIGGHFCRDEGSMAAQDGFAVHLPDNAFAVLFDRATKYFVPDATAKIRLLYQDEDEDWVVLDSTEDLIDAVVSILNRRAQRHLLIKVKKLLTKEASICTAGSVRGHASETICSENSQAPHSATEDTPGKASRGYRFYYCLAFFFLGTAMILERGKLYSQEVSQQHDLTSRGAFSFPTKPPLNMDSNTKEKVVTKPNATKLSITEIVEQTSGQTSAPITPRKNGTDLLKSIFSEILEGEDSDSSLYGAFRWIEKDPHWKRYPIERLLQRFGLAAFFYATSGENWHRKDAWLSYQIHECHWWPGSFTMSVCGEDKYHRAGKDWQYQRLWLPNNGLEGTLPPKLFQLVPSLRHIRLDKNIWLSGTLPSELGLLTALRQLWLHHNQFEGTIPSEIGRLIKLEKLCLAENDLKGTVPSAMFKELSNLRKLWIDHNRLTGRIPTEIGLSPLTILSLSHNHFAGRGLPASLLGSLTLLEELKAPIGMLLSEERLVPTEIGLLTNLRRVDMFVSPDLWFDLSSHKLELSEVSALHNLESFRIGTYGNDEEVIELFEIFGLYNYN